MKVITVRLPNELHTRIVEESRASGFSMNQLCVHRLSANGSPTRTPDCRMPAPHGAKSAAAFACLQARGSVGATIREVADATGLTSQQSAAALSNLECTGRARRHGKRMSPSGYHSTVFVITEAATP